MKYPRTLHTKQMANAMGGYYGDNWGYDDDYWGSDDDWGSDDEMEYVPHFDTRSWVL